jgi:hypothetical protein
MSRKRAALEVEFLGLCRVRGPEWIESVIRPLGLAGAVITPRDIPVTVLFTIVRMFGQARLPAPGIAVVR